jgi:anaerobic ribonucleoside-triphosphate reductase
MSKEEMKVKEVGQDVGFDRIRRITGYLVGTTDRFNNGKRAEERDRVKHGL